MAKSESLAPIEKKSKTMLATATSFVINNYADAVQVAVYLKQVKEVRTAVEDFFKPQVDSAYKTWKILTGKREEVLGPVKDAEKILKDKKTVWDMEQDRMIQEKEAVAAAAAAAEYEKERTRLLSKLGKAKTDEKKETIEQEIDSLHIHTEMVDAPPSVDGMSRQASFDIKVISLMELIKAIADGTIGINVDALFTIKIGTLKNYLKSTGNTSIPGCVINKTYIQRIV